METVRYCEHLFQSSDARLSCFISPMGPFLDPGSRGFEEPERYGYRQFARTLEEHRQRLVQPSWKEILSYETRWMDRDEIVAATYDAGEALNALKLRYGRIDPAHGQAVARRIAQSRALQEQLDRLGQDVQSDAAALRALRGEIHTYSVSTVCDKRELFWRRHLINFKPQGILGMVLAYARDLARRVTRRLRRAR
jgi:hypothetical protein